MRSCIYVSFLCLPAMSCANQNEREFPLVEVELNKPVETIKGKTWRHHDDGRVFGPCFIETPTKVQARFPSGRVYSSYSKMVHMSQAMGKVRLVELSPFSSAMRHDKAVSALKDIAAEIERLFEIPADRSIVNEIGQWKTEKSTRRTRGAIVELEKGVELQIRIVAIEEDNDEWVGEVTFSYSDANP